MSEILNLSTICRCCHTDGEFKSLLKSYVYQSQVEVYSVLLQTTFNINIQPQKSVPQTSFSICDECIVRVRDATRFKQQVLECERRFTEYCINELAGNSSNIKQECESDNDYEQSSPLHNEEDHNYEQGGKVLIEIEKQEDIKLSNVKTENDVDVKNENSQSEKCDDGRKKVDLGNKNRQIQSRKRKNDSNGQASNAKRKKSTHDGKKLRKLVTGEIPKEYEDCFIKITPELRRGSKPLEYQCLICNEKVIRYHIVKHLESKHNRDFYEKFFSIRKTENGQEFKCKQCKQEYTNTDEYHVHSCDKNWNEKCEECGLIIHGKQRYNWHLKKHGAIKRYSCTKCKSYSKSFKDMFGLRMHVFEMHSNRRFQCDHCSHIFKHRNIMLKHLFQRHQFMNFKKLICEICGWGFNDQTNLRYHVEAVHLDMRKFSCDQCPKTYKTNKALKAHKLMHDGVKFTCDVCPRSFGSKDTLTAHKKIHDGPPSPNTHIKGNIEIFKCRYEGCEKEYKDRRSRARHYRVLHKFGTSVVHPYQCQLCLKIMSGKAALAQHVETHSGIKKFQCTLCLARFSQKVALNRHITHKSCNRPKPAVGKTKCVVCNRGVTDMEKHLAQHSSRPFKCPICPNSFNIKGALNRHISTVHGEQTTMECDVCLKKYRGKRCLYKHRLRVHGIKLKKENYDDDVPAFEITPDNVVKSE